MRRTIARGAALGLIALACVALAGCGSGSHKVQGRVHFPDGSPLAVGTVNAECAALKAGATGHVREDGTFEMSTTGAGDGLPAGTWDVTILNAVQSPKVYPDRPSTGTATLLIHNRFTKKETSKLTFKVPEQANWDITVEKP